MKLSNGNIMCYNSTSRENDSKFMLNRFRNRNVEPMASSELTFARQLNVFTEVKWL